MNKKGFIEELQKELKLDKEKCIIINDCLEENFIVGKKNKEKTVNRIIEELKITKEEAENIYEISSSIIAKEIKNKLLHPFKSKD